MRPLFRAAFRGSGVFAGIGIAHRDGVIIEGVASERDPVDRLTILLVGVVTNGACGPDKMARFYVCFGPADDGVLENGDGVPEGVGLEIAIPIAAAVFGGDADLEDVACFGDFSDAACDLEICKGVHLVSPSVSVSMETVRVRGSMRSTSNAEGPRSGNRICG